MDINLTLFAQAVVFAIFIWFTAKFVWPPLMRAVEARQKTDRRRPGGRRERRSALCRMRPSRATRP